MEGYVPHVTAKNSEDFLPPASCKFKSSSDDKFVSEQNPDRERIVCAIGIDVHYELNVVAKETGSHMPRLKPFNPRMSGPACPYNYTGKFIPEAEHNNAPGDPVAHGRLIEKKPAYNEKLYKVYDPRLVSKTVVVRDYGCKVPIDIVDTEKIARAVLNHYPDQYIAFLGEFVSNMFGVSMRKFLDTQRSGYQKLLQDDTEINKWSWSAYRSVQGGKDTSIKTNEWNKEVAFADHTLTWSGAMDSALQQLAKDGRSMIGQCSAEDVYDIRPCLRQHIETLTEMIDVYCRGFGSKEEYVMAMLWWCNEQGRNMTADLQLIDVDRKDADYDRIRLHVPINFYVQEEHSTQSINEPDMNTSIRGSLRESQRTVYSTPTQTESVGAWTGTSAPASAFMGASGTSQFHWGWGHVANSMMITDDFAFAPHLRYKVMTIEENEDGMTYKVKIDNVVNRTFVRRERWSDGFLQDDGHVSTKAVPEAQARRRRQLEDALNDAVDDAQRPASLYRGFRAAAGKLNTLAENNVYQLPDKVVKTELVPEPREHVVHHIEPCPQTCGEPDKVNIVNPQLITNSHNLPDPFFLQKSNCFQITRDGFKFDPRIFGPMNLKAMVTNSEFYNMINSLELGGRRQSADLLKFRNGDKPLYFPYRFLTNVHKDAKSLLDTTGGLLEMCEFPRLSAEARTLIPEDAILELANANICEDIDWEKLPADTVTSFKFEELSCRESTKLALRIVALRTILQYSCGADVAQVICENAIYVDSVYLWQTDDGIEIYNEDLQQVFDTEEKRRIVRGLALNRMLIRLKAFLTASKFEDVDKSLFFVTSRQGEKLDDQACGEFEVMVGRRKYDESDRVLQPSVYALNSKIAELQGSNPDVFRTSFENFTKHTTDCPHILHVFETMIGKKSSTFRAAEEVSSPTALQLAQKLENASNALLAQGDGLGANKTRNEIAQLASTYSTSLKQRLFTLLDQRANVNQKKQTWISMKEEEGVQYKAVKDLYERYIVEDYGFGKKMLWGDARKEIENILSQMDELRVKIDQLALSLQETHRDSTAFEPILQTSIVEEPETEQPESDPNVSVQVDGLAYPYAHEETVAHDWKSSAFAGGVQKDKTRIKVLPLTPEAYRFSEEGVGRDEYNMNIDRPQLFAMLDACGIMWDAREFFNPSDCNRPEPTKHGEVDDMHYWCRTLAETFVYARQQFRTKYPKKLFENSVKSSPHQALPASMIGSMTDRTFREYFPLLPLDHTIRDRLRKMRSMEILWGTLPNYRPSSKSASTQGAWMPFSVSHQVKLMQRVGLFDDQYMIPCNPWLSHNGRGISRVFNQSYHTVWHCDSYQADNFEDWQERACKYQRPSDALYPFSQYGGTPVEADFVHHRVDVPEDGNTTRCEQLVYNRFGFTGPMSLGQQFRDTGLLQDMFSFKYRNFADLTRAQRKMPEAKHIRVSNFMAYARNHAIIALASCNHGTEEPTIPRIVRNLYRLYVDTYKCMGAKPDDDGVPAILGFLPTVVENKDARPVVLYAGTLSCLNSKLEKFCMSSVNKGERVCHLYKQVYLNDAALLFNRMLRQERRRQLHDANFARVKMKRSADYKYENFLQEMVDLQDAYIEFLQTTILGMLIESGADLNGAPLHLLEPRELEVSMYEEDDNLVGNDFLTPRTREIIKSMDFSKDNLNRTQLAILSLIPPNHQILGTLKFNQSSSVVDLEHIKRQIQKDTEKSNKGYYQKYLEALIGAAFGHKLLATEGPIDMSFDMSAIKDPLKESENIKDKMTATHAQTSSSLSMNARAQAMRNQRGPHTLMSVNEANVQQALELVRANVEEDYYASGGTRSKAAILAGYKRVPEHIKGMLMPNYAM